MASHNVTAQLLSAYINDHVRIVDPGDENELVVTVQSGVCEVASGTRYLPSSVLGVEVMFFASGSVTIKDSAETTVLTLTAGQMGSAICNGGVTWTGAVYATNPVSPADITAIETDLIGLQDNINGVQEDLNGLQAEVNLSQNGPTSAAALITALTDHDSWKDHVDAYGDLRIPSIITLTTGLTLPYVGGGKIVGAGRIEPNLYTNQYCGPMSGFVWGGTRVGTEKMVTYQGQQCTLSHLNFWGDTRTGMDATPNDKCPILFQTYQPGASLGTGQLTFDSCVFSHGLTGINYGTAAGESNSDEITFRKCFFDRLTRAMRSNNHQCLDILIHESHIRNTRTFFDVKTGGNFKIRDCTYGNCVDGDIVFNFDTDVADAYGPATSYYEYNNIKVDAQSYLLQVIKMVVGRYYYADVHIKNNIFPQEINTNPIATICGKTRCFVTGNKNLHNNALRWHNDGVFGTPTYILQGNIAYEGNDLLDWFDIAGSTGTALWCSLGMNSDYNGIVYPTVNYGTIEGAL
jgi:hypothetical protein